ncbi:hypothetical protein ABEG17_09350 [Pedococcus sp. KACC 23699]|uniref:Ribbon-helix-helix protein, CopG family n=1 Tax=Pedococcus sp. KACC 23699 TaxID=3149228 RepID=A0AAU7JYI9_9MICO
MAGTRHLPLRRWIVRTTIGSFSLAAFMGIVALLTGGGFGPTERRVLLTTLLVGVASIAVLSYLSTAGRRSQPVGVAGGISVLVPLACGLFIIWGVDLERGPSEGLGRTFGVGAVVAATLAQASLLLAVADSARRWVTRMLFGTLAMAAVLAVMVCVPILGYEPKGSGYFRVLGVVAILDVLGTVVLPAVVRFGAGTTRAATPPTGTRRGELHPSEAPPELPASLEARLTAYATSRGTTREAVVAEALEEYLDAAEHRSGSGSGVAG